MLETMSQINDLMGVKETLATKNYTGFHNSFSFISKKEDIENTIEEDYENPYQDYVNTEMESLRNKF